MTQARNLVHPTATMPIPAAASAFAATDGDPRSCPDFTRRLVRQLSCLLTCAMLTSTPAFAQRLYVADSGEDKIAIVDVSAAPTVIGNIPLAAGAAPRSLALSADATTLAVGNFSGSVSLVDLTRSPAAPFATLAPGSGNLFGVAFSPDGKKVYATWSNKLSVIAIDAGTANVISTITISANWNAVAVAVSPDGTHAYVVTGDTGPSDSVEIVDLTGATPAAIGTYALAGGDSEKIVVSPDGTRLYVSSQDTNAVSIIDIGSATPLSHATVTGPPKGIAISADGHKVYAADNGASVVDVSGATPAVTDIAIAGAGEPFGVALSHDGATLYVTDLVKNTLTTIATATNSVTGSTTFGNTLADAVFSASTPTGVTLSMAPATVPAGAYSVLTVTLTNPTATAATITSLHITLDPATDAYGLVDNSCGGTFANFGGEVVGITAGTLPASGSCTLHIQTTANAPGTYTHKVLAGDLQTSVGNNAADASVSFTAVAPIAPTVAAAFSPATIAAHATSTLTVTIANANSTDLELISLTDTLPSGLVIAATSNAITTCPGAAVNATAGGGSFTVVKAAPLLPVATIPAGGGCTASVAVTAAAAAARSYVDALPAGAVQAYLISLSLPDVVAGNVADNSTAVASATLVVDAAPQAPAVPAPALGRLILLLLATLIAVVAACAFNTRPPHRRAR
ncbi:beta-propeller fold lactonase family protein [Rudaea cellulosilytica]|uniref:DUF7933 domain-containing protein n=1 Tax=Rudaea cellulosilytica TaxID=540746 RepID=UPI00035D7DEA|nr:YncE family protein [Rudaea cellulosilytica]